MGQKVTQAVVVPTTTQNPTQGTELIQLFNPDGTAFGVDNPDMIMTGYTAHAAGNVAATDTLLVAIAKLEARIATLEAA
jgi:hypothetical protein